MFEVLIPVSKNWGLNLSTPVAQGYNGASVISNNFEWTSQGNVRPLPTCNMCQLLLTFTCFFLVVLIDQLNQFNSQCYVSCTGF